MRIRRHDDPVAYAALVTPLLLADEARYNLELAVAGRLASGRTFSDEPPVLLTVHDGDALAGAAVRTPPWNLLVSAVPVAAMAAVREAVGDVPAILGTYEGTEAYAAADGRPWRVEREQGVFRLTVLTEPRRPANGVLRPADADTEPDLIHDWILGFCADADLPPTDRDDDLDQAREGRLFLWDDGGPVSLVGVGGTTPNGVRVGPVYTPPEHRGRGYATTATAAVTRLLLGRGHAFTFLYTDLSNAVANRIYPTLGYERVAEVRTVVFDR